MNALVSYGSSSSEDEEDGPSDRDSTRWSPVPREKATPPEVAEGEDEKPSAAAEPEERCCRVGSDVEVREEGPVEPQQQQQEPASPLISKVKVGVVFELQQQTQQQAQPMEDRVSNDPERSAAGEASEAAMMEVERRIEEGERGRDEGITMEEKIHEASGPASCKAGAEDPGESVTMTSEAVDLDLEYTDYSESSMSESYDCDVRRRDEGGKESGGGGYSSTEDSMEVSVEGMDSFPEQSEDREGSVAKEEDSDAELDYSVVAGMEGGSAGEGGEKDPQWPSESGELDEHHAGDELTSFVPPRLPSQPDIYSRRHGLSVAKKASPSNSPVKAPTSPLTVVPSPPTVVVPDPPTAAPSPLTIPPTGHFFLI